MRDIKNRIRSIGSTMQITKAMQLVAAAKVRKTREKVDATRPFFLVLQDTIGSIIEYSKNIQHPSLQKREVKKTAYIVLAGDRGLCGGYNSNMMRAVSTHIGEKNKEDIVLITIGAKAKSFFEKEGFYIEKSFTNIPEVPSYGNASKIGKIALEAFFSGKVDEVYLCYTEFESMVSQVPKILRILPLEKEDFTGAASENKTSALMNYEPSAEAVLNYVVQKYVKCMIFSALVDAGASEQAARMTAMENSTKNAEEIIDTLTLTYNRARQAAITQEIAEIVGGAAAQE